MMDEQDERIVAWESIAGHPFFKPAYDGDGALLPRIIEQLDALVARPTAIEVTRAEEPVEDRIVRAFANGYREGMERGARGRLDAW
jgi:hypothetical protein